MPGASGSAPTSRLVALPKRRHAISRKPSIRKPASTRSSATPRPSDDDWRQWVRVNEAWRGPPLAKRGLTKHWIETAGALFSLSRNRRELPEHSDLDILANGSIDATDRPRPSRSRRREGRRLAEINGPKLGGAPESKPISELWAHPAA